MLTNDICLVDPYVRIAYRKEYSDVYSYTYRTIGYEGSGAFAKASYGTMNSPESEASYQNKTNMGLNLSDTTKTDKGVIFTYPKRSFDVEVTRIVNTTGASSTKFVHFNVNELQAGFSYVVDGVDSHHSGEPEQTVRLNQGSRVVFTPDVEGGNGSLSFKWNLIEPLNTDYYNTYGGSVGRDGLTSERVEPVCYFYNGGTYRIQMTVSDGQCSASVRDSAMYIDRNTVRSYRSAAVFEEDFDEEATGYVSDHVFVDVYPTRVTDYFEITTNSPNQERYELFDARGVKVKVGDFINTVRIATTALPTGVYTVKVCGKVAKVLKV